MQTTTAFTKAQTLSESSGVSGKYIITVADTTHPEAKRLETMIQGYRDRGNDPAQAKRLLDQLNSEFGVHRQEIHNLVPTVGRAVFAARLAGTTTYTGTVNKVALGSGSTAPANGDTQLTTETYRNTILSATYASNIAYLTGFFTAAETSGTYAEVGLFIDGTATANTGQLFSHALAAITKSSIQTLTIDWIVTIS